MNRHESTLLDPIDLHLLTLLQENGRRAQQELAHAVGLSAPAVAERLRKLEERGVIRRYTALLDARALGMEVTAFVAVAVQGSRYHAELRHRAERHAAIQECHSVTGDASHLLKVRVRDTAALEQLLAEVQGWPGVQRTTTSVVLSTVKETPDLPVAGAEEEGPSLRERGEGSAVFYVPFRNQP